MKIEKRTNFITMCYDLFMYGVISSNSIKLNCNDPDFDLFYFYKMHLSSLNKFYKAIPEEELAKAFDDIEPEMRDFIEKAIMVINL
jgi:hypothetical protein